MKINNYKSLKTQGLYSVSMENGKKYLYKKCFNQETGKEAEAFKQEIDVEYLKLAKQQMLNKISDIDSLLADL